MQAILATCVARPSLGVTDRVPAVLDVLVAFYPADELSGKRGLIAFPSNTRLSIRARGMAPRRYDGTWQSSCTPRLMVGKDSPIEKRYARRGRAGEVEEALGFSLALLLAWSA
ncbi:helix-turn-helix domain-containing protein [Agrobacterium sp. MS2]|uniref:helix-turn-helix domain-containing protein n=1 Tax=Agrobacterium sp. MS2 TaxID=1345498 RepID=UPI000DBFA96D|nr:hypothetical protein DOU54_18630 [Agrobacterium sp. MS2]